MKLKFNKGFSLIELMIVVAIIGILAAIAVPSYQSYVNKSRFAEIFSLGGAAETAVSEYISSVGGLTAAKNAAGCTTALFNGNTTNNVTGFTINSSDCSIQITGSTTVFGAPLTVTFTPSDPNGNGSIVWACSAGGFSGAPSTCSP